MSSCGVIANHYPFILVTLILPAVPTLYITAGHLYSAARYGRLSHRGEQLTVYSVILIPVIIILGAAFFKAAYDYTYLRGAVVTPEGQAVVAWKSISTPEDEALLRAITRCLSYYYLLAGFELGLAPILVALRKYTDSWLLHLAALVAGPLMFIGLETLPVKRMYYAYAYAKTNSIAPGTTPFSAIVWPAWSSRLLLGLAAGLAAAGSAIAIVAVLTRGRGRV
ncbi:MAG: hypothetical protein F7C34_02910 [Desulfurococcales archaeon]|nr:hypothetical protein [Desulfurococcales archaeon]